MTKLRIGSGPRGGGATIIDVPRLAAFYGIVRQWARLYPQELADNWERAQALEPLVAIEPLP